MVAVEIQFFLHFSTHNDWRKDTVGFLEEIFHHFEEMIQELSISLEGHWILISFDVEEGEETMDVAAAFLPIFIGTIYSGYWRHIQMIPSEVHFVSVVRKFLVEGSIEIGR